MYYFKQFKRSKLKPKETKSLKRENKIKSLSFLSFQKTNDFSRQNNTGIKM